MRGSNVEPVKITITSAPRGNRALAISHPAHPSVPINGPGTVHVLAGVSNTRQMYWVPGHADRSAIAEPSWRSVNHGGAPLRSDARFRLFSGRSHPAGAAFARFFRPPRAAGSEGPWCRLPMSCSSNARTRASRTSQPSRTWWCGNFCIACGPFSSDRSAVYRLIHAVYHAPLGVNWDCM